MKPLALLMIALISALPGRAQRVDYEKPLYRVLLSIGWWLEESDSTGFYSAIRDTTARFEYRGDTVFCFGEDSALISMGIYDSLRNIVQEKTRSWGPSGFYTKNYANTYDSKGRLVKSACDNGITVKYRYRRKFINERETGRGEYYCTEHYFSDKECKREYRSIRYVGRSQPRETSYKYDSQGRLVYSTSEYPGLGTNYTKYTYFGNVKIVEYFDIDCLGLYAFIYAAE